MQLFDDLIKVSQDLGKYSSIANSLNWDSQTCMPKKGAPFRAQQLAFIEEQIVNLFASSTTKSLIQKLDSHFSEFDDFQKRNIEVFKKAFNRRTAVPKDLLIENKKQELVTFSVWQEAKHKNDFKLYAPELAKNISNKQQMTSFIDNDKIPFDVYLDQYEPGFSSQRIETIFNELRPKIISLLQKIQSSEISKKTTGEDFSLSKSVQQNIIHQITSFIGYDISKGRIDHGEHPMTFSGNNSDDVRFTVNYNEKNYFDALFAGLHEAGHAIHGQNRLKEYNLYPITMFGGSAGISESQSRFFENIIGRSESFWTYYLPLLSKTINKKLNLSDFLLEANKVQFSRIRIHADELTYPLHIILRFEIEKGLLDGSIKVTELPNVWNEKFEKYLGLEIKNDSEGVMQDIHWATGFYGYFPTYALGNIYNAQMYHTMRQELDFDGLLTNGTIGPIRNWLIENVHKKTGLYDPEEFVKVITHEEVNPKYFISYLVEKFSKLYD